MSGTVAQKLEVRRERRIARGSREPVDHSTVAEQSIRRPQTFRQPFAHEHGHGMSFAFDQVTGAHGPFV